MVKDGAGALTKQPCQEVSPMKPLNMLLKLVQQQLRLVLKMVQHEKVLVLNLTTVWC